MARKCTGRKPLTCACSDSMALYTSGRTSKGERNESCRIHRMKHLLRSRNTDFSVLLCNICRLSSRVIMFCGGSLIANKGFRLGNTIDANCVGVSICEMENTLGNMYGRRCLSFISSKREGKEGEVLTNGYIPHDLVRTWPIKYGYSNSMKPLLRSWNTPCVGV